MNRVEIRKPRGDADRRKRQALRYARIIAVSRLLETGNDVSEDQAKRIGDELGVCSRTIYRDIAVIREANKMLSRFERSEV